MPQQRQGGLRITLGKPNLPSGMGCKRCQVGRLDRCRILVQLGQSRGCRSVIPAASAISTLAASS